MFRRSMISFQHKMALNSSSIKKVGLLLCGLILSSPVYAADHSEDFLNVNGEGYYIRANPLNKYLSHFCKQERLEKYVEKFCVPNWPNYTRYWEIRDDQLYIIKVETKKGVQYPFHSLFYQYDGMPVFANWFSGILSYRRGNSPKLQLNHLYYEKETVVRISNGIVTEIFETDHRQRWIEYSNRLLEEYYPLTPENDLSANIDEAAKIDNPAAVTRKKTMTEFWADTFYYTAPPSDKISRYYPSARVEINANLDHIPFKEAYRELTSLELLKLVTREDHISLDMSISDSIVVYTINKRSQNK